MTVVEVYNPHARGTDTETAKALQHKGNVKPLSFVDSLPILKQNLSHQMKEWEIVPIGASLWNAYKLYETCKSIDEAMTQLDVADQTGRQQNVPFVPLLAGMVDNFRNPRYRRFIRNQIFFLKEQLKRYNCSYYILGIRILKVSAILITDPLLRKGVEGVFDASSHAVTQIQQSITLPEHVLYPARVTWKDKAHSIFKNTVTQVSLLAALLSINYACGGMEESDPLYQNGTRAATIMLVSDIGYGLLQKVGILAKRE